MSATQRLDKWLWYIRLVKTRSAASRLITGSKVRVNRDRVTKPARAIGEGDVVTAIVHRRVFVLKVVATGARRGPASEAAELYEDLTPKLDQSPGRSETRPAAPPGRREQGSGRPTKRDRRRIDRLRNRRP